MDTTQDSLESQLETYKSLVKSLESQLETYKSLVKSLESQLTSAQNKLFHSRSFQHDSYIADHYYIE